MLHSKISRHALRRTLDVLTLFGGVVLLVAVSWEIISGDNRHFSHWYMALQFVVCILFLLDFFVRLAADTNKMRFFLRNIWFLIISVPYLNIIGWMHMPHSLAMLIGIMPLARAFLALYVVVRWLVASKIQRLLTTYLFTAVLITYISSLIFYDYEIGLNPHLHHFGDAFWWAWMNVTTVGAEIFPVTAIGKVICVVLPIMGMMFFPIFTTYIMALYQKRPNSHQEQK